MSVMEEIRFDHMTYSIRFTIWTEFHRSSHFNHWFHWNVSEFLGQLELKANNSFKTIILNHTVSL